MARMSGRRQCHEVISTAKIGQGDVAGWAKERVGRSRVKEGVGSFERFLRVAGEVGQLQSRKDGKEGQKQRRKEHLV